jgi:hypothetical protein
LPKRSRHIDSNLIRAVNPEGEDLLQEPPVSPEGQAAQAALEAIGEFVLEYPRERYGGGRHPLDLGQALGLSEALLQAMALRLKKDPERIRRTLEEVVMVTNPRRPSRRPGATWGFSIGRH